MNHKFTLLTHDYPPAKGGVARYLSSLVKASNGGIKVLVPLDSSYIITRTSYNQQSTELLTSSTTNEVRQVRFWSSLWPNWLPLIKRCLEIPEHKIILVSHVFPIGTAAFIANALGGAEYGVIFHGTDLKRVKNRWKRWLLRRICNNAKLLIVNSQATKKLLLNLAPKVNPLILTPGIEHFSIPNKTAARAVLGVDQDNKVILAVSRLVERKGIDTLIQSVTNIKTKYELVIVGDGDYTEQLHKLAELSGVNVRWVDNADDQTLYSWYAAADIFCLPGREVADDIEGFGMVFLEAAYAGLPVIAGQSGGASEAVVHNQTGLLIPPTVDACTEAIAKLIEDHVLARNLGAAGRNRVIADFNWVDRWNELNSLVTPATSINTNDSKKLTSSRDCAARQKPNISVVIPCYNHAKELQSTLKSLTEQTIGIKQVIVVDDGSNDNPLQVAESFKKSLSITTIRLERNSGAPTARNRGAQLAKSEFIIFLDADAVLKQQALELMLSTLAQHPEASYAYGDFLWGNRLFRGKSFNAENLRRQNYIHTSALIRKVDFPGFDESLRKFQDWDLWLIMLNSGKIGVWIPEVLFSVTERKNGMSQWLPSFIYKLPWPIMGYTPKTITKYRIAENIIKEKHNLK